MATGDAIRRVRTALASRGTPLPDSGRIACPAHGGERLSLAVEQGKTGALVCCHSKGCTAASIAEAIGIEPGALFDDWQDAHEYTGKHSSHGRVTYYQYADEGGSPLFRVVRTDFDDGREKKVWQERFEPSRGEFVAAKAGGMKGVRRVLYRLGEVRAAVERGEPVYVTEGEKAADALREMLGVCATTASGGAGKWLHTDAKPPYAESLRGATVVLLPDADEPGEGHMLTAAAALLGVAASVKTVRLPGLPSKGDAVEWLGAGGTLDVLHAIENATPPFTRAMLDVAVKERSTAEAAEAPHGRKRAAKKAEPKPDPFPVEEPWPTPVDGAELLDSLRALLRRYLVLPPSATEAIALWIVHTYVIDAADFTPYILITSPVRECGKSTLLELLSHLAYRAQLTGGITAPALFRRIDRLHPTMLLDEMDARLKSDGGEALRGVLNTGFHRTGKMTICVGEDHEERDFATFGPKVLAGIGRVWDTVTSRSIPLRLRRATKAELSTLAKIRGDRIAQECLPYRRKLLRWAEALQKPLHVADPVAPDELGARQSDVWRPLLAIADVAGGHWPETAREAARVLHGVAEDEGDHGLLLLGDLRDIFKASEKPQLTSVFIGEELAKLDARPWPEYRNGRPITPAGLASLLKRFEVKSKNIRAGGDVQKGYELDALQPLFALYLPSGKKAATPATPLQSTHETALLAPVADVAAISGGRGRQAQPALSANLGPSATVDASGVGGWSLATYGEDDATDEAA